MHEIFENCCGLDVHRDTVVACVLLGYGNSAKKEIRTFSTKTCGIKALAIWLKEHKVRDVVIESTGIYWKPIFNHMDESFKMVLVNPYHVKNAKGKKTDVSDCEWLCRVFKIGAVRASFVPPRQIRRLRELVRHRHKLVGERSRIKSRIIKNLESANIKLNSVFSDVFGYTSWLIVSKIIAGVRCVVELTSYIHERVKASRKEIQEALEGVLEAEDIVILKHMISHKEYLDGKIQEVEEDMDKHCASFSAEINRLITIPGVGKMTAIGIISEIGIDMTQFPTHEHLASWTALCPGNSESAGKQRSGRTRKGNPYIKSILLQAAWAASKAKNTYLQSKYRALTVRKGSRKAATAVAHSIVVACYYILRDKREYQELGANFLDTLQADRKAKYHVKRLEELGFHVSMVEKVQDGERKLVFI